MISKKVEEFINTASVGIYDESWWDGGSCGVTYVVKKDDCEDIVKFALSEFKEKLIKRGGDNKELINLINSIEENE